MTSDAFIAETDEDLRIVSVWYAGKKQLRVSREAKTRRPRRSARPHFTVHLRTEYKLG